MNEPKCRYCGGAGRFQIVSLVSDHAWATCFCSRTEAEPAPRVGDGSGDAAIAIGEHAFKAGWDAGNSYAMCVARDAEDDLSVRETAWSEYDPPEHIKALS